MGTTANNNDGYCRSLFMIAFWNTRYMLFVAFWLLRFIIATKSTSVTANVICHAAAGIEDETDQDI